MHLTSFWARTSQVWIHISPGGHCIQMTLLTPHDIKEGLLPGPGKIIKMSHNKALPCKCSFLLIKMNDINCDNCLLNNYLSDEFKLNSNIYLKKLTPKILIWVAPAFSTFSDNIFIHFWLLDPDFVLHVLTFHFYQKIKRKNHLQYIFLRFFEHLFYMLCTKKFKMLREKKSSKCYVDFLNFFWCWSFSFY